MRLKYYFWSFILILLLTSCFWGSKDVETIGTSSESIQILTSTWFDELSIAEKVSFDCVSLTETWARDRCDARQYEFKDENLTNDKWDVLPDDLKSKVDCSKIDAILLKNKCSALSIKEESITKESWNEMSKFVKINFDCSKLSTELQEGCVKEKYLFTIVWKRYEQLKDIDCSELVFKWIEFDPVLACEKQKVIGYLQHEIENPKPKKSLLDACNEYVIDDDSSQKICKMTLVINSKLRCSVFKWEDAKECLAVKKYLSWEPASTSELPEKFYWYFEKSWAAYSEDGGHDWNISDDLKMCEKRYVNDLELKACRFWMLFNSEYLDCKHLSPYGLEKECSSLLKEYIEYDKERNLQVKSLDYKSLSNLNQMLKEWVKIKN